MPAWGRNTQSFEAALFLLPSSVRYSSFPRLCVKTTRFCTVRQEMSLDCLNTVSRESRVLCPRSPVGFDTSTRWSGCTGGCSRTPQSVCGASCPPLGRGGMLDLTLLSKSLLLVGKKVLGYRLIRFQSRSYLLLHPGEPMETTAIQKWSLMNHKPLPKLLPYTSGKVGT